MVKSIGLLCAFIIAATVVNAEYDCRGKTDGFYSDLEYCHIYWRCNYGQPEEYECPASTAWNHKEGRCDWLDNVDCTRDGTMVDPNSTEATESTEPTTTTEETLPPQFPLPTTNEFDDDVIITNNPEVKLAEMKLSNYQEEKNLTDQILELLEQNTMNLTGIALRLDNFQDLNITEVVKHLEAKSMNLTAEMALLNQTTEGLKLKPIEEETVEPTTITTTTLETTTTTPIDWDLFCQELPGQTGFMANPFSCNKYIRCNHGKSQQFTCASGTVWDTENMMCLWSESVDCAEREDDEAKNKEQSEEEYEYYTDEELAAMEEEEAETTTTTTKRPEPKEKAEGLVDITDAPTKKPNTVCQSFGSYFAEDSENCGAYYLCTNGEETKMTCPEKQLFNAETSLCSDFQTVFCGNRPVNHADKNQCLSKRDGIYPDIERQCQVFYQCIKQEKVREASCPVPLKFNAITGRCDNPLNILAPCGTYNPSLNSAPSIFNLSKILTVVAAVMIGKLLL